MADKPSRALVLYGDGLARSLNPSHAHLHSLALRGSCGFLSLPQPPPSETEDDNMVIEFTQLLDSSEVYLKTGCDTDEPELQKMSGTATIRERFQPIWFHADFIVSDVISDDYVGLHAQLNEFCKTEEPLDTEASKLLKLLGFLEGKALENNQFDLVLLHIGCREKTHEQKDKTSTREIDYVNSLVGAIMQVARPGTETSSRFHLSVVMSYEAISEGDESSLSVLIDKSKENTDLSSLFPRQSYMMKGSHLRENTRYHCPMLIAQWQDGVTRKDMANTFSFKEFKENSGNLTIPADRFLHEVAFKLWKAPKYGA